MKVRDVLRFASMENGEQCVMTFGLNLMLLLFAISWDFPQQVRKKIGFAPSYIRPYYFSRTSSKTSILWTGFGEDPSGQCGLPRE